MSILKKTPILICIGYLFACSSTPPNTHKVTINLNAMEQLALCKETEDTKELKTKITAEYGFRMSKKTGTFKPILPQSVFGHNVRIITMDKDSQKIYVDGKFPEIKHHFGYFFPEMTCDNHYCKKDLEEKEFSINTFGIEKIKETVLISCKNKNI